MQRIQRKYQHSSPTKKKQKFDWAEISTHLERMTLDDAFSGTYVAVELEILLNNKSLASKLTEKDMDVDV